MNLNRSLSTLCRMALMSLIILTVASCSSKKDKLLESVPDDVEFAVTMNFIDLAKKSNISVEDGRLILPREYSYVKENLPDDFTKTAGKMAEAVDLENVVVFGYVNKEAVYVTFALNDPDSFRSLLKNEDFERDRENGYEIYAKSDSEYADCWVISEDETQAWFVDRRRDVKNIEDFELARKKNNILKYSGLKSALTADNIVNVVFDQTAINSGLEEYWATGSANIVDNAIVLEMTAIKTDGEPIPATALQEISPDFLRYIPSNFLGVAAFGLNPDGEWVDQVKNVLTQMAGHRNQAMVDEVMPYIKAVDGTVAFGFGPKNKSALLSGRPDGWQAIAMVHMTQSKVNSLTELLKTNLPQSTSAGDGLYKFEDSNMSITYGMLDGYFAIGVNTGLKPDKNNSFASDFTGKSYAMVLQSPMLNEIVDAPKLSYSVKAFMELNGSTLRLQIKLVGADSPIIPTLVADGPVFFEALEKQIRSSNNYSYGDQFDEAVVVEEIVDSVAVDTVAAY